MKLSENSSGLARSARAGGVGIKLFDAGKEAEAPGTLTEAVSAACISDAYSRPWGNFGVWWVQCYHASGALPVFAG